MHRLKALASPTFWLPMIVVIVVTTSFALYYEHLKETRQSALDRTAIQALASASAQFSNIVDNATTVLVRTASAPPHQTFLAADDSLLKVSPEACSAVSSHDDVRLTPDGQSLTYGTANRCLTIPLETTLTPLVDSLSHRLFDDVVITNSDGMVLYQTHVTGLLLSSLSYAAAQAVAKGGSSTVTGAALQATSQQVAPAASAPAYIGSIMLASVALGTQSYRVYGVPIPIRVLPSSVSGDLDKTALESRNLYAYGLITAASYQDRTRPIPDAVIGGLTLLMLLVLVGTWPLLKFLTMRAPDRISRMTGLYFPLTLIATVILFIMLVLHIRFVFSDPSIDQHLVDLSDTIDRHFAKELQRSLTVLKHAGTGSLGQPILSTFTVDDSLPCTYKQAVLPQYQNLGVLKFPVPQFGLYPYFVRVYGFDRAGFEQMQWSIYDTLNTTMRVCDRPYFREIQSDDVWLLGKPPYGSGAAISAFRVDPLYSQQTGQYFAVIAQSPSREGWAGAPGWLNTIMMVTSLLSLNKPVLPADYGFAVIDHDGRTLFSSDASENGRTSFYDDLDDSEDVRAAIATKRRIHIDLTYQGLPTRTFVSPFSSLSECPWTLITYSTTPMMSDKRVERMLLFAALTVGYYFLIVAPCILIMWLLPRDVGAHLWPCASKKGIYLQLAFAFSVITSVLYSFLFRLPSLWLLIFSCFTTMLCTGMSIIALSRSRKWGRRIARSFLLGASIALALEVGVLYHAGSYLSVKWVLLNTPRPQLIISAGLVLIALAITTTTSPRVARRFGKIKVIGPLTAYTLAAGSFMLIVAALPTLAMFKLAYDHFEVKSVIRDEWLAAESLDHRSANIRKFYKDVSFGEFYAALRRIRGALRHRADLHRNLRHGVQSGQADGDAGRRADEYRPLSPDAPGLRYYARNQLQHRKSHHRRGPRRPAR